MTESKWGQNDAESQSVIDVSVAVAKALQPYLKPNPTENLDVFAGLARVVAILISLTAPTEKLKEEGVDAFTKAIRVGVKSGLGPKFRP